MSINLGEIITNFNELEEGKDYFVKIKHCFNDFYSGIYTYNVCGNSYNNNFLKFINETHEITITTGQGINEYFFRLKNLNDKRFYFRGGCNIFEILTNEYVLK